MHLMVKIYLWDAVANVGRHDHVNDYDKADPLEAKLEDNHQCLPDDGNDCTLVWEDNNADYFQSEDNDETYCDVYDWGNGETVQHDVPDNNGGNYRPDVDENEEDPDLKMMRKVTKITVTMKIKAKSSDEALKFKQIMDNTNFLWLNPANEIKLDLFRTFEKSVFIESI